MRYSLPTIALVLSSGFSLVPQAQTTVVASDRVTSTTTASETYRLRIENAPYGKIDASVDGGKSYVLLGRVVRPAGAAKPDKSATQKGVVLTSASEGITIAVSRGYVLKIRPAPEPQIGARPALASSDRAAEILTSVKPGEAVLGKLLPPLGSQVMLQVPYHGTSTFTDSYSVSPTDAFVILVDLPPPVGAGAPTKTSDQRAVTYQLALQTQFESIAAEYSDGAMHRAAVDKRKVAGGSLALRTTVPADEPDPITAITYAIDDVDNVIGARTIAPYEFVWDTTTVSNGEHVVEVRGLSANGSVITRTRYLAVINNVADRAKGDPSIAHDSLTLELPPSQRALDERASRQPALIGHGGGIPGRTSAESGKAARTSRFSAGNNAVGRLGEVQKHTPVFRSRSTVSEQLDIVDAGTYVAIKADAPGWYAILTEYGETGWIPKACIKLLDYKVVSYGSPNPSVGNAHVPTHSANSPGYDPGDALAGSDKTKSIMSWMNSKSASGVMIVTPDPETKLAKYSTITSNTTIYVVIDGVRPPSAAGVCIATTRDKRNKKWSVYLSKGKVLARIGGTTFHVSGE